MVTRETIPGLKLLLMIILFVVLYFSIQVVIVTLIGIGLGVLLSPLLDKMQKKLKIKRGYAALVVIFLSLIAFALISFVFGQVIFDQARSLAQGMPEFTLMFREKIEFVFSRFPYVIDSIKGFDIPTAAQTLFGYIFKGAQIGTVAVGGLVFALILGIYLAVDSQFYYSEIIRVFYPENRETARELLLKCAIVVRAWFRAQLLDMAIIGLLTTIGLWIVGVQYWALFGFLTAVLGIIPYVGIMLVLSLVSFIVLVSEPTQFVWVLLVFFITQQIEGNIVLPMVMKGQVEIPEAYLIITMLFFGFWFGILGIFIAPPIVAVLLCLYRNLYLRKIEEAKT